MIIKSELGLTVPPPPLNLADIIDMGGRVSSDLEELVDYDMTGMPLSLYQSVIIIKDVEDLIEGECFKDISPPPEPLTPEMEFPGLGVGVNGGIYYSSVPFPSPQISGRAGWELISLMTQSG